MTYSIKQNPEDFLVEEIPMVSDTGVGNFSYYILKKTNLNTLTAIRQISDGLQININRFGWAGSKDKNAITKQMISILNVDKTAVENLFLDNIKLTYFGRGRDSVYLGNLIGNKFHITLRNLDEAAYEKINKNLKRYTAKITVPNYFDEQRFGKDNVKVGKLLLEKKYAEAAQIIYRKPMKDPIVGLRAVNKNSLAIYIHAIQSLIFNRILTEYIKENTTEFRNDVYSQGVFVFPNNDIENLKLPMPGFGTEIENKSIRTLMENVMRKENLTPRDFVLKQLPELSQEGRLRDAFVNVNEFRLYQIKEDEINKGKKKTNVTFTLPKGSYATMVVRALCS